MHESIIMSNGQIVIPGEIRKLLCLDSVSFIVNETQVILENSAISALKKIQKEFEGEAKKAGIQNEEDVEKFFQEKRIKHPSIRFPYDTHFYVCTACVDIHT